jgi:hypothetical protein
MKGYTSQRNGGGRPGKAFTEQKASVGLERMGGERMEVRKRTVISAKAQNEHRCGGWRKAGLEGGKKPGPPSGRCCARASSHQLCKDWLLNFQEFLQLAVRNNPQKQFI